MCSTWWLAVLREMSSRSAIPGSTGRAPAAGGLRSHAPSGRLGSRADGQRVDQPRSARQPPFCIHPACSGPGAKLDGSLVSCAGRPMGAARAAQLRKTMTALEAPDAM